VNILTVLSMHVFKTEIERIMLFSLQLIHLNRSDSNSTSGRQNERLRHIFNV